MRFPLAAEVLPGISPKDGEDEEGYIEIIGDAYEGPKTSSRVESTDVRTVMYEMGLQVKTFTCVIERGTGSLGIQV